MTASAIESLTSIQMNGKKFSLSKFARGTVLEIRTLHHNYTLIVRRSRSMEVIFMGDEKEHLIPKCYTFHSSFSEIEGLTELEGDLREGFQLELFGKDEFGKTILQTSHVKSVRFQNRTLRTWMLRKSFDQDLFGSICKYFVSNYSRFFTGTAFL